MQVATLEQPLAMAVRRRDPALYIAEKTGKVVAIRNGTVDPAPVLDLSGQVSLGGEQDSWASPSRRAVRSSM